MRSEIALSGKMRRSSSLREVISYTMFGPLGLNKMSQQIIEDLRDLGGHCRTDKPFFSIIMPAYGVCEHIAHAIECVQRQSFRDWELIVVDDCSTDGSGDVAKDYAERDDRIRVVRHEHNEGLSAARNTGIAEARGVYLWMPDSDDSYDLDLLTQAHASVCECGFRPDVLMFGYAEDYYDSEGRFLYANEIPMSPGFYGHPQEWRNLVIGFERDTHYGYAWNKLYLLKRVKDLDLRFEKVRLIEDITFNVAYYQNAGSLVVMPGSLYRYAKRRGRSLTNANAYSAEEYYALHRRRIEMLKEQFDGWGVLDVRCKGILGSLYGRYILSTLERSCYPGEGLSRAQRIDRCKSIFEDPLFEELIPRAKSEDSSALKLCLGIIKSRSAFLCTALGRAICFTHANLYPVFTKLRSGR